MMEQIKAHDGAHHDPETKLEFGYEGGGFPWFMRLIWIAFLIFFVVYTIKWYVPDLAAYFDHAGDLLQ